MYVIYGATGFIGGALQSALTARRVPYLGFGSKQCIRNDGAAVTRYDASTPDLRSRLLRDSATPRAIIFAAGTAITSTEAANLESSHFGSLVDAFDECPGSWWKNLPFVYTSSCTVYGRPTVNRPLLERDPVTPNTAYASVKLRCEDFVKKTIAQAGAQTVRARLFNISGFGQRVGIVAEIAQQAIEIEAGKRSHFTLRSNEPILDLVDVNGAATALLALADTPTPPEVVNVCSGRPVSTEDIIAAARRAIGRQAPVQYAAETERHQMLVGDPALMFAQTGWRACASIDEIMAAVISGRRLAGDAG